MREDDWRREGETGGDPYVPGSPDLKLKTYRVEDGEVVVYLSSGRARKRKTGGS